MSEQLWCTTGVFFLLCSPVCAEPARPGACCRERRSAGDAPAAEADVEPHSPRLHCRVRSVRVPVRFNLPCWHVVLFATTAHTSCRWTVS